MWTEFNDYNGTLFNIRTRALNNLVYWLSQIIGSVAIGFLLDQQGIRRRIRAYVGWFVLLVIRWVGIIVELPVRIVVGLSARIIVGSPLRSIVI